jgi:hypothetical protein
MAPATWAQEPGSREVLQRLQELETEIARLRAEVAQLKAVQPAPSSAPSSSAASAVLGGTEVSGFVDAYYSFNNAHPAARTSSLRAFDGPSNQFALNLIEVIFQKTPEADNSRLGYKLALGYGQAINAVNNASAGDVRFAQYLKEGYFSYLAPVGKGLAIDVGKFVTPHGAEVIETKDNWNYSRGLLFTYAIPFYHFGARAKYAFNPQYSLTAFLVNGWNNIVDNNSGKTYGVSFGWTPTRKIAVTHNYMFGPEQSDTGSNWRQLHDTVVALSATPKLTLQVNYDYGREGRTGASPAWWTGAAAYAKYAFNRRNAIVGRYEYYNDHDGLTTGARQHLNGVTATYERLVAHHLLTRLEYRRDISNLPAFLNRQRPVPAQSTITAGFVYMFDAREAKQPAP